MVAGFIPDEAIGFHNDLIFEAALPISGQLRNEMNTTTLLGSESRQMRNADGVSLLT
jgi:hypothetical protein